jgi:hypothetical protein
VLLKLDFDAAYPLSEETLQPAEEWHAHRRNVWKQDPWFRGITRNHGQVEIDVEYTVEDRSRGDTPSADRDWVTGKPYLVKVENDQALKEELSVVVKSGQSSKGKSLSVTVIEVQAPRYVEPTR